MPSKRKVLKTYLTDEAMERIKALCAGSGMAYSTIVNNLIVSGSVIPARTPETWKKNHALSELRRINADQARLGNLLKRALNAGPDVQAEQEIRQAMAAVSRTRSEISATLRAFRESFPGDC